MFNSKRDLHIFWSSKVNGSLGAKPPPNRGKGSGTKALSDYNVIFLLKLVKKSFLFALKFERIFTDFLVFKEMQGKNILL